jgi:NADPH2:quinone reductase
MTYARSLGYDQVVLRENFVQAVQELTNGRGVDIILDAAGEPTRSQGLTVLAPFGRLVNCGNASGQPEVPLPLENLRATNKSVMSYSFHGLSSLAPQMLTETARKAFQLLASGQIRVDITKILPMEQAAEAHRLLENGATTGKLLLSI